MKRTFTIIAFCWYVHQASAQCRFDNTTAPVLTTNPANTNWPSPPYDQLYKKNTGSNLFDWRQQWFNVQMPNTAYSSYSQLLSPYWQTSASDHLWNIIGFGLETSAKGDFQPADGWELIKRDFGTKSDGSVNTNQARVGPYFILYNRFSGTLRVLGYLPAGDGGFPVINVRLNLISNTFTKPTGIFAYYNRDADLAITVARPLDQSTTVASISTPAKLGAAANIPFFADFQLAYDPCTCNFASALQVSFEKVQTMKVDLYGKILGTTQPISTFDSQNGVAQYKDYLTSVYNNRDSDYKINAGMITYSNVQKMYDDYQTSAARARDYAGLSLGLDILKTALDLGGVGINAFFDGQETNTSKAFKNGFDAAGILSSFFSSRLGDVGKDALPTVVTGEMALVGQISNQALQNGNSVSLANPGSLGSQNAPECCLTVPDYPMYNEVLGAFALLSTPKINYWKARKVYNTASITDIDCFRFLPSSIAYRFNPAVRVNLSKTKIYGALEVRTAADPPYYYSGPYSGAEPIYNYASSDIFYSFTTDAMNGAGPMVVFQTPFVPLDALGNITPRVTTGLYSGYPGKASRKYVYLKLMVLLESNDVRADGSPNRSVLISSYPVQVVNTVDVGQNFNVLPNTLDWRQGSFWMPEYVSFMGGGYYANTFSQNTNIGSWESVNIVGVLTAQNNALVTVNGLEGVVMSEGASINSGFALKCGYPFPANPTPLPVSDSEIQSYCSQSSYRANIASARLSSELRSLEEQKNDARTTLHAAYPNPFSQTTLIGYSLANPDNVTLYVSDLMGKRVAVLVDNQTQEAGEHTVEFKAAGLSPGVYLYTLQTTLGKETKRLVIVK